MELKKQLTIREREVLRLIGSAKSSKEIAASLGVSIHTIGNHRRSLCRKLGAHSTAELVAVATRLGSQAEKTACSLALHFRHQKRKLRMTYRGHLSDNPAFATVRIGDATYHF